MTIAAAGGGNGRALEHPQLGVPVAVYEYQLASGEVAFYNLRFEPKDFRAAHPTSNGRIAWNLNGVPTLLYRLPDVEAALATGDTIWIVDGEKDAGALAKLGVCATCCARAQGWSLELAEQLIGARWVKIVADWDGGRGLEQAREVRELLLATTGLGSHEIEIVRAAEGKDAYDHIAAGHKLTEFVLVEDEVDDAPAPIVMEPLREFRHRPLPPAESLVGAARNGTNLLPRFGWVMPWGPAGSGKTSILVDLLFHACGGIDWLGYKVERPLRVVAIVNEGIPGALQDKLAQKLERWPHDADLVLDNLAVFVSPWGEFTFRDQRLVDYARDYAVAFGADYVALDPLHTVSTVSAGAPDETEKFKHELRAFGVWNDLGVITAHHSNKVGMISGDWARHADTVLHIEKVPKLPASKVTLQKARPADPNELGVPVELRWLVETFGYERHVLDTSGTSDAELLDRIRETVARAGEPISLNRVKEETKGDAKRIADVVREAVETGALVNVSTTKGWFKVILPEQGAEYDTSLHPASQQTLMVEPEKQGGTASTSVESALTESQVVSEVPLPLGSAPLHPPRLGDDDTDDLPDFGVRR